MDLLTTTSTDALEKGILAFSMVRLVIALVATVFFLVMQMFLYKKMGEPMWVALIPFYSTFVFFKHCVGNGLLMFLTMIPFFGAFYALYVGYKFIVGFNKGFGFFILYLLLPVVALPILAFGSDDFSDPV